jgi:hypothetical protein
VTKAAPMVPTWPIGGYGFTAPRERGHKGVGGPLIKKERIGGSAAPTRERWRGAVHELCLTEELLRHLLTGGHGR